MKIQVHEVAHHRNGIGGEPFYAVLFRDPEGESAGGLKLAVLFERPGACAVLGVPELSGPEGVAFGRNSWRGDHFEPELRAAVAAWEKAR